MKSLATKLPILVLFALFPADPLLAALPSSTSAHPQRAVPGSTKERRAALQRLTPEQRQELLERAASLDPALRSAARKRREDAKPKPEDRWVRGDLFGQEVRSLAASTKAPRGALSWTRSTTATSKSSRLRSTVSSLVYSGPDLEGDGLPNDFEDAVADAFTPVYHVSSGEQAGTGFARFGDYTPQTIIQNLPAIPPVTHVRVIPVGFASTNTGQQYGFLQIDYLTIWNRDDGLDVGGDCRFYASVLGGLVGYGFTGLIDGLGGHAIDNERSAVLVAAPTPASFQYSTDPDTYQAYDYYTAAHEGTFFDHSAFLSPSQPVAAHNHLNLGLSRSKHGTYSFNPDGLPLIPDWIIFSTYFTLDDLYYYGYIGYWDYLVYLGMADALFYACVVEQFDEQGGWLSDPRINAGELNQPLNGSGFILDAGVQSKLTPLLWQIQ